MMEGGNNREVPEQAINPGEVVRLAAAAAMHAEAITPNESDGRYGELGEGNDPADSLVSGILSEAAAAAVDRDRHDGRAESLGNRIALLREEETQEAAAAISAAQRMVSTLRSGRVTLWEGMDKTDGGYAYGVENVRRAVMISPEADNMPESSITRQARVEAVVSAGQQIKQGEPFVMRYHEGGRTVYYGGVAAHDGLSVTLKEEGGTQRFSVGVNGRGVTIDDAVDTQVYRRNGRAIVDRNFGVYGGEVAKAELMAVGEQYVVSLTDVDSRLKTYEAQIGGSDTADYAETLGCRQRLVELMVDTVHAAHDAGVSFNLDDLQSLAQEQLRTHMLGAIEDTGNALDTARALRAGQAMRYLYPEGERGDQQMVEDINAGLEHKPYTKHNMAVLQAILQQTCSIIEE